MTDDSVVRILERRRERRLKEETLASVRGSLRPRKKTFLTLKSSGVKEVVLRRKG